MSSQTCPFCGTKLNAEIFGGLCPRCVLHQTSANGAPPEVPAFGQTGFKSNASDFALAAGRGTAAQASAALERLCHIYWYPLYAYIRRRGYGPEEAQDLIQAFFAWLLAKRSIGTAHSRQSRFRAFLLSSFDDFLANEWSRVRSEEPGDDKAQFYFGSAGAEQRYRSEAGLSLSDEERYERNCALQLLKQVRSRLQGEYATAGQAERFDLLERFLPGQEPPPSSREAAVQLGVTEGDLVSEVQRLEQRHGELLREELAKTIECPEEIEEEVRHLLAVIGALSSRHAGQMGW